MFTVTDENIRYGFKLLGDPQEAAEFFHNIRNNNPYLYSLLFDDKNGFLYRLIGITQKTTEQRAEEKKNFVRVLFFGLGVVASANANRSVAIKLPQPNENQEFAYWIPDLDPKRLKEINDRCQDEKTLIEICLESQKKISQISQALAKHLAAFIEIAYDNLSGLSIGIIYILIAEILLQTKEEYEWRERTFRTQLA
jgi:hypothetical protein